MSRTVVFNLLIFILVVAILAVIGSSRIDNFQRFHHAIATETVSSGAKIIENFIAERKRLVALFARDHSEDIRKIIANPDNLQAQTRLQQRIKAFFPDHFTFTIANLQGVPYLEDFDGLVGEVCRHDLVVYASSGEQAPRIHPHPSVYHFDISASVDTEDAHFILFISFHANLLGSFIRSFQTEAHQVILVIADTEYLIEATESGARDTLDRLDFRLSSEERQRILASNRVGDTSWTLLDLQVPGLFSGFRREIVIFTTAVAVVLLLIMLLMVLALRREERRRRRAEHYKEEFLSVISHELRTPITSITGSLRLLQHGVAGELSEEASKLITLAVDNGKRLDMLINDLLDVRSLEAGKMQFTFTALDITGLIEQSISINAPYAEKHGKSLCYVGEPLTKQVRADAFRLTQVLTNLISNAVKYGAEHDCIEIRAQRQAKFVRVSVSDHGQGIAEEFRSRIFGKFEQATSADNRSVKGTGLGLSIVKYIMQQHNGSVDYHSTPGQGTTFFIDVPVYQA